MAQRDVVKRETAIRSLNVTCEAWLPGERIPERHTADGADISPAVRWSNLPERTGAIALVFEDLDADGFTHWSLWNVPPELGGLPEQANVASTSAREGRNDFGSVGYRGPNPPPGDEHRYALRVYALTERIPLRAEVRRSDVDAALRERILAQGEYVGIYSRDE